MKNNTSNISVIGYVYFALLNFYLIYSILNWVRANKTTWRITFYIFIRLQNKAVKALKHRKQLKPTKYILRNEF